MGRHRFRMRRAVLFVRGARGNLAYLSLEGGVGGSALIGSAPYHGSNGRSCRHMFPARRQ